LFIGSGNFIPGFEEGLIGVAVGDTVDIPLTFPENCGNASLAGQDVVFTVTVNSLKALPELNDAFIAEKTEFDTVAAYKEDIRATLQSSFDATIESQSR
jgi:trigger factor